MTNPSYGKCYPFDAGSGQQAGSAEWRVLASAWGDGIVGDNRNTVAYGGDGSSSFQLAVNASDRIVTLTKLGAYRLRGIMFEPTQDSLVLGALPAPAAGQQQSHLVMARLTPANKQITFEIKSGTATTGTPSRPGLTRASGGVWEDPIWRLDGGNGAGSTLTRSEYRRWVAPGGYMLWDAAALDTLTESAPMGSRAQIIGGDEYLLRSSSGDIAWVNLTNPDWKTLSTESGINGTTQQRLRLGRVECQGQAIKATGSWGPGTYTLGTLPTTLWPKDGQRGNASCVASLSTGGLTAVNAWVNTSGQIRFTVPAGTTLTSFYIDAISYAQEA